MDVGIMYTPQDKTSGPTIADLDQDGYLDIIQSQHARYPVEVYYGSAANTFRRTLAFVDRGDRHGTAAGDVDGNGKPDILLAIGGSNGLNPVSPRESRTAQNGTLVSVDEITAGLEGRSLRGVAARFLDMDRDGDLDLFVLSRLPLNRSNQSVHAVYRNLPEGKFQLVPFTGIERCTSQTGFLVTDFDSDGNPDIFLLTPQVRLFKGDGNMGFSEVTNCALPPGIRQRGPFGGAVQLDIDNDGDMDILFSGGLRLKGSVSNGSDLLLENLSEKVSSTGCVLRYQDISSSANLRTSGARHGITVADFNNDGFIDVFMPEVGPGHQRIGDTMMLNLGNKRFVRYTDHGANGPLGGDPTFPMGAQAFDYNQDGKVDIVVASRYNSAGVVNGFLRLFENQSNGGNYLIVKVPVSIGGMTTMDALLTLSTPQGSFYRRVGSVGEFRTQSFIDQVHFGLGSLTLATSISIKLMTGEVLSAPVGEVNRVITPSW
uniref:ASPIC/UnbV domain-containing protein n=1 Tax=Compsopogon caeruleus TaxID=31354 RepID=A0A7S1TAX8_9RHOD